jgi:hypothetical protein
MAAWLLKNLNSLSIYLQTPSGQVTPFFAVGTEPSMKRCRLETSLDTELVASCYWLLLQCYRLQSIWSWPRQGGSFPLHTSREMEMRLIVTEKY